MENYILMNDETILYRGEALLLPDGKYDKKKDYVLADVLLTNYNIVFTVKKKKLFKSVVDTQTYSITDIKIYDETVQVIRRKSIVDIYLNSAELFMKFKKEKDAKEFCDKALKLVSGYSKFVRSVKKTQKAIKETNEALDIDVVEIAKEGALFACEVATGVGTVNGVGKKTKVAGKIAGIILKKNKKDVPEISDKTVDETEKPEQ